MHGNFLCIRRRLCIMLATSILPKDFLNCGDRALVSFGGAIVQMCNDLRLLSGKYAQPDYFINVVLIELVLSVGEGEGHSYKTNPAPAGQVFRCLLFGEVTDDVRPLVFVFFYFHVGSLDIRHVE